MNVAVHLFFHFHSWHHKLISHGSVCGIWLKEAGPQRYSTCFPTFSHLKDNKKQFPPSFIRAGEQTAHAWLQAPLILQHPILGGSQTIIFSNLPLVYKLILANQQCHFHSQSLSKSALALLAITSISNLLLFKFFFPRVLSDGVSLHL